jgi:hypothetical protein
MKNRKAFLIYIIVSIVAFVTVILPRSEMKYYNYLEERLENSNKGIKDYNNEVLKLIDDWILFFPEQKKYLDQAELIDFSTNELLNNNIINVTPVYYNFLRLIEEEEDKISIKRNLANYESLRIPNLSSELEGEIYEAKLRLSANEFLIYYASKCSTVKLFWNWERADLSLIKNIAQVKKPYEIAFFLSKSYKKQELKIESISANNETLITKKGKAIFKLKFLKLV